MRLSKLRQRLGLACRASGRRGARRGVGVAGGAVAGGELGRPAPLAGPLLTTAGEVLMRAAWDSAVRGPRRGAADVGDAGVEARRGPFFASSALLCLSCPFLSFFAFLGSSRSFPVLVLV